MVKRNRKPDPSDYGRLGMTLVEAIIAITLFSVVALSAYGSFRSGFIAYQRIESQLGTDHEMKMMIRHLNEELRNAVYYANIPFEGESDKIRFAARLNRFDGKRMREDLYAVTYQFRSRTLERSEEKLRKVFADRPFEKEKLLTFETFRFQFAYRKRDGGIEWKNGWEKNPYLGIPRGIRILAVKPKSASSKESAFQVLIPHGTLGILK